MTSGYILMFNKYVLRYYYKKNHFSFRFNWYALMNWSMNSHYMSFIMRWGDVMRLRTFSRCLILTFNCLILLWCMPCTYITNLSHNISSHGQLCINIPNAFLSATMLPNSTTEHNALCTMIYYYHYFQKVAFTVYWK